MGDCGLFKTTNEPLIYNNNKKFVQFFFVTILTKKKPYFDFKFNVSTKSG